MVDGDLPLHTILLIASHFLPMILAIFYPVNFIMVVSFDKLFMNYS